MSGQNIESFSIREVRAWMETEVPKKWRQSYNVRVLGAGGDDGFNSPFVSPLIVPESIAVLISPPACGRHCSVGSVFMGDPDRMFLIRIKQKDLVTGSYLEKLGNGIEELLMTVQPSPKAVFICGSCSDVLLASDYKSVAAKLEKKYKIRVAITGMEPILNDSRVNNIIKTESAIYHIIQGNKERKKQNEVNIIGRTNAPNEEGDFCKLLKRAGIERINHVTQFQTLEEYDRMSEARLNIAVEKKTIAAAQSMEKRFGIPYLSVCNTFDVDEIRQNYRMLEKALGVELDDTKYYEKLKKRIASLKTKYGELRTAVGESYSYRSPKAAVDVQKLGFSVKGLFVREIKKCDKENIIWLSEHCPDLKVYFTGLPTMIEYMKHPDHYDIAIGLESQYFINSANTIGISVPERYFDYDSLEKFINIIECTIKGPKPVMSLGQMLSFAFGRDADIVLGCEKDFGMFGGV